jgi:membrane protein insertase Oxa1/YidC/SpoIIIJ
MFFPFFFFSVKEYYRAKVKFAEKYAGVFSKETLQTFFSRLFALDKERICKTLKQEPDENLGAVIFEILANVQLLKDREISKAFSQVNPQLQSAFLFQTIFFGVFFFFFSFFSSLLSLFFVQVNSV